MTDKATVQPIQAPKDKRVLVVSDIHAVWPLFEGVLRAADYDPARDVLILLGDLVEKGPDSLTFLRWLMEFVQNKDVRLVMGNCDHLILTCASGHPRPEALWRYLQGQKTSLLWQMGRLLGFIPQGPGDLARLGALIRDAFPQELDFLAQMPTILEGEKVLFVHGGIPDDQGDLTRYDAHGCMKNDNFLTQESRLTRWCVVGHTPVTLYRPHIPCADPIVDGQKRIIAIDGGCAIKPDGQLNCLILPELDPTRPSWVSYDGLPQVTALAPQTASPHSRNIHWGQHRVRVLSRGGEFSRCRQLSTGYELDILTEFLWRGADGADYCEDSTDYRLPVAPGDVLHVVRQTSRGLLAKKNGVTGWYSGPFAPVD